MFPFMTCDFTGSVRPGYAVCHHVIRGVPVAELRPATDDEMGVACCMVCARLGMNAAPETVTGREFELVCADCVEMMQFGEKVGSC
jgi:hypothetical protein